MHVSVTIATKKKDIPDAIWQRAQAFNMRRLDQLEPIVSKSVLVCVQGPHPISNRSPTFHPFAINFCKEM